jgi:S1-C subfamily serine protease
MSLIDSYKKIKPSIVAFCQKYSDDPNYGRAGKFPDIIGTGFIIDESGLVLTNQHVVDAFDKLPSPSDQTDPFDRVGIILFDVRGNEIRYPSLEILGATKIKSHIPQDNFWDREPPDISLVNVNLKGLPYCKISDNSELIKEGLDVATAGFPMGTLGLTDSINGPVSQLTPVLQKGVISAIKPWAVANPLSFTINVLIQGGASGSPVFEIETGEVIGVLAARRFEPDMIRILDSKGKPILDNYNQQVSIVVKYPTSFSIVVPTYLIATKIEELKEEMMRVSGDDKITLEELYKTKPGVDFIKGESI